MKEPFVSHGLAASDPLAYLPLNFGFSVWNPTRKMFEYGAQDGYNGKQIAALEALHPHANALMLTCAKGSIRIARNGPVSSMIELRLDHSVASIHSQHHASIRRARCCHFEICQHRPSPKPDFAYVCVHAHPQFITTSRYHLFAPDRNGDGQERTTLQFIFLSAIRTLHIPHSPQSLS